MGNKLTRCVVKEAQITGVFLFSPCFSITDVSMVLIPSYKFFNVSEVLTGFLLLLMKHLHWWELSNLLIMKWTFQSFISLTNISTLVGNLKIVFYFMVVQKILCIGELAFSFVVVVTYFRPLSSRNFFVLLAPHHPLQILAVEQIAELISKVSIM